jgi:TfoX/Sxy family transcriptional regulator of competence genes
MAEEAAERLDARLDAAAGRLDDVVAKRLFGCHALFRSKAVFALVWKTGRIAVKLPDPARHRELLQIEGAEPWVAHAVMAHWVLVPEDIQSNARQLAKWVTVAHELAGTSGPPGPKAKRKSTAREPAPESRRPNSGTRPTSPKPRPPAGRGRQ